MSEQDDRALEAEARALLLPAREPPATPPEVRARALRRLMLALPLTGPGHDGGDGGGGAPPSPGTGGGPSPAAAARGIGRALGARVPAWSLLVSFVAGGAVAAVVTRSSWGTPESVARRPAPVEATLPSPAPVAALPSPTAAVSTLPAETPSAPSVSPAPSPPSARASSAGPAGGTLEAERALLDVARTALGRGDGPNALRAAEAHARQFPRGLLAEEREAMSIQALRLLHRDDEARARLDRFRGRFPTSLIRPALEADDGGSP